MPRIFALDSVKFFLICLVILGHTLGFFIKEKTLSYGIYNFIYLFHMPLFVFLSGYFTKSYGLKSVKMWISLLMLFESYILFDVLHRIPDMLYKNINLYSLIEPSWSLWYLLSLIYWRFSAQFFSLLHVSKWIILISAVVVGLVSGFLPIGYGLSIQRTFSFFPFFICGFLFSKTDALLKIKAINTIISVSCILISLLLCLFLVNFNISDIVWGGKPYAESIFGLWHSLVYRFLFFIVSSLICVSVLNLFLHFFSRENIFAVEGKKTMLYYVYHTFMLGFIFYFIEGTMLMEYPSLAFVITPIVIFFLFCISRFSIFSWLTNPITNSVRFLKNRGEEK
ncbi:acyltransferase family protein [Fibrobacter sp. UWB1]|uniref:acyltransferase family protein n=1 Tax=Fibrobacter sp. UWB1 TaxID=1964355 RepID=UPI000B526AE8|nr:acyltransferase family protein [Fibrobacter sp. UWB1]